VKTENVYSYASDLQVHHISLLNEVHALAFEYSVQNITVSKLL